MNKRLFTFLVAALFLLTLCPANVTAAEDIESPDAETTERVYEEVLSGNITSHEDVLAVALAQYASTPLASRTYTYYILDDANDSNQNTLGSGLTTAVQVYFGTDYFEVINGYDLTQGSTNTIDDLIYGW